MYIITRPGDLLNIANEHVVLQACLFTFWWVQVSYLTGGHFKVVGCGIDWIHEKVGDVHSILNRSQFQTQEMAINTLSINNL